MLNWRHYSGAERITAGDVTEQLESSSVLRFENQEDVRTAGSETESATFVRVGGRSVRKRRKERRR